MRLHSTVLAGVALLLGAACGEASWASLDASVGAAHGLASGVQNGLESGAQSGLEISGPLRLDAKRLMAMKPGEQVSIAFPVVGKKTVVFEALTKGRDGVRYWHGRLAGSARDRVFLKQTSKGLVGAIRFGSRQLAFKQQAAGQRLTTVSSVGPVAGQAYVLGTNVAPGIREINGNFAALTSQAFEGSEIALPLPNGDTEVAVVTQSRLDDDGFVQVQGISRMDGTAAPTVITVGTDGVFGTVYSNGREYQIVTRQGKTQIIDPQGAGWAHVRGEDQLAVQTQTAAATAAPAPTTTLPIPLATGKIDTTITLLMSYSASYVAQWGSEALARTRLSNIVQVANAAYANSGTGIQFRIVGWSQRQQPDTTPQINLPAMRADTGNFKGLSAIKRSTGAAITVFFAPFNKATSSSMTCGLAYVPAAGAQGLAAYKSQVFGALFASLNDGQSNGYYCETLSLAHELGHNLGNSHDKANASFPGAFAYSYGKGVSGSFGTVMSYISPRVALFSSPQLSCGASKLPCGSATENVVATMLQTKATVAAQGNPAAIAASMEGFSIVSGWVVNANGSPYTGALTVKPSQAQVTCASGTSGLYVCKVPTSLSSVSVSVAAAGKVAAPALGSFTVDRTANTPVTGTRFYLSDPPKAAAAPVKK